MIGAKWLPLVAGGIAGTVSRYLVSEFVQKVAGHGFPYGTMVVNLTGCFLLGFLSVVSEGKFLLNPHTKLLLIVGFCGAFTTFSTLILESTHLLQRGENIRLFLNLTVSLLLGFAALKSGLWLGEHLR